MIQLKLAYDKPAPEDGFRVLVERFWPRDLDEKHAKLDLWLEEAAPSDLHTVFGERSEERRVGKECLSVCRSRWSPYH